MLIPPEIFSHFYDDADDIRHYCHAAAMPLRRSRLRRLIYARLAHAARRLRHIDICRIAPFSLRH